MTLLDQLSRTSTVPDLTGENYLAVLQRLHETLAPRSYFEVGTYTGDSLALATCATVAVDPGFEITGKVVGRKPMCCLYQTKSDRFFVDQDLTRILGRPVDLAFLDGMHWAEYLLRDFIQTERHCRRNSVIAMHDCVPVDVYIADRDPISPRRRTHGTRPDWWSGDVWKTVLALKRFRPDLVVHALDAAATGLVLVTNLDPGSTVLETSYAEIMAWFRQLDLQEFGLERFMAEVDLQPTSRYVLAEDISAHFWL